ncbi:Na+/H+ antiporter subunit E [Rhizobium sp. NRK18]|jgi:multicomponent Na+:H+ antiporter subunit E|uniref:Na+/H+ antiporter subunit E n=1 Tax=Rhizobium sp. NRK18 TaxID=2964667 RepID=UPI0021C441D3|nr:Na+/H+ antiporter subunit E [Rhizobium sp. NRK18]MCQ2004920.1 Na+/H+ antiporter subunit E [Rhizobium sp. NRK18]
MRLFVINLILALIWVSVTGNASLLNLGFGFVLALLALGVVREQIGGAGYFMRGRNVLSLLILFLKELALSAWGVARLVLRRDMNLKPGIFAFPLTVDRDFEIVLLANMITLTPGTLSVDVSEDRKTLYVHAVDCSDPEGTVRSIADGFERKIMEAFR